MQRDPAVLKQIEEIDALLQTSGVRDMCLACWRGELKEKKSRKYPATYSVGCCTGPVCKLLGPTGCTAKPLNCALWLCHAAKERFPKVAKQLAEIAEKWPIGLTDPHIYFRDKCIDFELSRLKCAQ